MYKPTLNKLVTKIQYTDNEKRFLLKNSKIMTLSEIAKKLGRSEKGVKNACSRFGFGYITKLNN